MSNFGVRGKNIPMGKPIRGYGRCIAYPTTNVVVNEEVMKLGARKSKT